MTALLEIIAAVGAVFLASALVGRVFDATALRSTELPDEPLNSPDARPVAEERMLP